MSTTGVKDGVHADLIGVSLSYYELLRQRKAAQRWQASASIIGRICPVNKNVAAHITRNRNIGGAEACSRLWSSRHNLCPMLWLRERGQFCGSSVGTGPAGLRLLEAEPCLRRLSAAGDADQKFLT